MTTAERIVAAVAWCATHDATVNFRRDAVVVTVGRRRGRGASLLAAVAELWPEMPA